MHVNLWLNLTPYLHIYCKIRTFFCNFPNVYIYFNNIYSAKVQKAHFIHNK